MQKGAKRIKRCKGQKSYFQEHVDRLKKPEESMSTGLVRGSSSAHAMRAGDAAHSAQAVDWIMQPVDWIMQHVDWMKLPWKNQSTGLRQKVQRRNPSRRKNRGTQKSCAV